MKLNITQAGLIAQEVHTAIKAKKEEANHSATKKKIESFLKQVEKNKKEYDEVNKKCQELSKRNSTYILEQGKNVGVKRAYITVSDTVDSILKEYISSSVPGVETIKNKIILKSLFSSEEDMKSFINSLIEEYTK